MKETKSNYDDVHFTRDQLELLETVFPERIMLPSSSEATMRFYMGQRSVVKFIEQRMSKYSGDNNG